MFYYLNTIDAKHFQDQTTWPGIIRREIWGANEEILVFEVQANKTSISKIAFWFSKGTKDIHKLWDLQQ